MSKYDALRLQLYQLLTENPNMKRKEAVQRFTDIGLNERTVRRWYNQYRSTGDIERKIPSGRPAVLATKKNLRDLRKAFNKRSGCSQRSAAKDLGCTQPYISIMLRKHIRCYKKLKRPDMTALQRQQARPKCSAMLKLYKKLDFILDDESYFTLSNANQPGNDRFYSDDLDTTPDTVKYNSVAKYPPKLLVWLAISPKGLAKPYFRSSGLAINQDTYLEILQKKLEPLIKKHYRSGGYVFWPDLATSHYASKVLDYLKSKNIPVVMRSINPANLPKARPIEDFWSNLKSKVYQGDWKAKNIDELKERIIKCLAEMDKKLIQSHTEDVRKRLDRIRRHGVE